MDYIYSQLNNTIEILEKQFTTTILKTDQIIPVEKENNVELNINTENLIRLLPIVKDSNSENDTIQEFQLFGYNINTKTFNIPIGDPIKINVKGGSSISDIKFKDANGNLIEVPTITDDTGALVIDYVPIAAISDTHIDKNGNIIYVESIIDGNG